MTAAHIRIRNSSVPALHANVEDRGEDKLSRAAVANDLRGYAFQGQMRVDEITGGSPYGAGTIAAVDGSRLPSASEIESARFQGRHVARTANALVAGRKAA
jgi:hypothetical protein